MLLSLYRRRKRRRTTRRSRRRRSQEQNISEILKQKKFYLTKHILVVKITVLCLQIIIEKKKERNYNVAEMPNLLSMVFCIFIGLNNLNKFIGIYNLDWILPVVLWNSDFNSVYLLQKCQRLCANQKCSSFADSFDNRFCSELYFIPLLLSNPQIC